MAAKEQPVEEAVSPEGVIKDRVERRLRATCRSEGGLEIPLAWRGHRPVQETLTFGPKTTVEVLVNSQNFDLTIVLDGVRYQTSKPGDNAALVQGTNPKDISFRTSAPVKEASPT